MFLCGELAAACLIDSKFSFDCCLLFFSHVPKYYYYSLKLSSLLAVTFGLHSMRQIIATPIEQCVVSLIDMKRNKNGI